MRKRNTFAALLSIVTAALSGASCLPDGPGPGGSGKYWKFAIEEIQGSVQHKYAMKFKELIEERSGGEVKVTVYPYGSIGTSSQITELLKGGAVQIAMASPGYIGKLMPEVQVFLLHFIFSPDNEVNRDALSLGSPVYEFVDDIYNEKGFKLLSIFPEGWMVWSANKPIRKPGDFEGVKFRTMPTPLLIESYRAYGANPTPMPYAEVFSGLQLGMIDGQVNPVFAIEEMSFYEVNEHLISPRHAQFVTSAAMNLDFYRNLPKERKELLKGVLDDLQPFIFEEQKKRNEASLAKIMEKKPDVKFIELSEAERERFRKASLSVREKFGEMTGERGEELMKLLIAEIRKRENR